MNPTVIIIGIDDLNSPNWMVLIPKQYSRPYLLVALVQYHKKYYFDTIYRGYYLGCLDKGFIDGSQLLDTYH